MKVQQCRLCESKDLHLFLDLGKTALANRFLREADAASLLGRLPEPEPFFPLRVVLCQDCGLVQLDEEVAREILFKNYIYVSGTSAVVRRHAQWLADYLIHKYGVRRQGLVVEAASNDGTLLKEFRWQGLRILGVEPAANVAALAIDQGIPTLMKFFDQELARTIRDTYGPAQLFIARHVLAHVTDLHGFVRGIKEILAPDGVALIEVPHLAELYENLEFDTIYHEHLCYFSLEVLHTLFQRSELTVIDVDRLPIHGGSILVHVGHAAVTREASPRLPMILKEEADLRLRNLETWQAFAHRVGRLKEEMLDFLDDMIRQGKSLAAYGAPAKGNTLLSYCGIGPDRLPFIVDQSPWKQGLLTPGHHIPILAPEMLLRRQPDVTLILAWNFAAEVCQQQAEYRQRGGRFAVPIPGPCFLDEPVISKVAHL
jgi:SAM-dependent methyltransferase